MSIYICSVFPKKKHWSNVAANGNPVSQGSVWPRFPVRIAGFPALARLESTVANGNTVAGGRGALKSTVTDENYCSNWTGCVTP